MFIPWILLWLGIYGFSQFLVHERATNITRKFFAERDI